jgi:hypothetical protein
MNLVVDNTGQKVQTFGINDSDGIEFRGIGRFIGENFLYKLAIYQDTAFKTKPFVNNGGIFNQRFHHSCLFN